MSYSQTYVTSVHERYTRQTKKQAVRQHTLARTWRGKNVNAYYNTGIWFICLLPPVLFEIVPLFSLFSRCFECFCCSAYVADLLLANEAWSPILITASQFIDVNSVA